MITAPHGRAAPLRLARQVPGRRTSPARGSTRGRHQGCIVPRARKRTGMVLHPVMRKYVGLQDEAEMDVMAEEQSTTEERPQRGQGMDNWSPWSTEVFVPVVYDTYNERATLHTFAELNRAAEDARSSLMSARWSRCCKLEAIVQQEERYLEATQELRALQPPAVEPPLPEGQWDLRALAECDTQLAREEEDWARRRANAATDSASAPDWRTDVRYRLPPTPALGRKPYHDCTLREIWDYITDRGQNADARDVEVLIEDPTGDRLDPRTSGAYLQQDANEMLEESGRLITQLPSGVVLTPPRRRKRNSGRQWVNVDVLRR